MIKLFSRRRAIWWDKTYKKREMLSTYFKNYTYIYILYTVNEFVYQGYGSEAVADITVTFITSVSKIQEMVKKKTTYTCE